jgi:hypothetical protein
MLLHRSDAIQPHSRESERVESRASVEDAFCAHADSGMANRYRIAGDVVGLLADAPRAVEPHHQNRTPNPPGGRTR